jgi:transposase
MHQAIRPSCLVPPGFFVEAALSDGDMTTITVRSSNEVGVCPSCGAVSRRIHSRYRRRVKDLPLAGRSVQLVIVARRFRCQAVLCGTQIFTERFPKSVLARSARRTSRLDCIVHHLGPTLGGRPAASFAKRLMLPVSNDTLLRLVRRRARIPTHPLNVIGIDDWAWRRNHRYGSIICNLERRCIVTSLPDREQATALAWFTEHPEIPSSHGIVVADTARPPRRRYRMRCRSQTAGILWKTPVVPFLTPYTSPCATFVPQLGRRRLTLNC